MAKPRTSITISGESSIDDARYLPTLPTRPAVFVTGDEKKPLSRAAIIEEISQVDQALKDMCAELESPAAFSLPIEISAMAAKATILKQRADLLHKLLNKTMADKKAPTPRSPISTNSPDAIPIHVLQKIVLGTVSEEELDIYRAALDGIEE